MGPVPATQELAQGPLEPQRRDTEPAFAASIGGAASQDVGSRPSMTMLFRSIRVVNYASEDAVFSISSLAVS